MSWQVQQTRRFARVYKKLTQIRLIADTDAAVEAVAENPDHFSIDYLIDHTLLFFLHLLKLHKPLGLL